MGVENISHISRTGETLLATTKYVLDAATLIVLTRITHGNTSSLDRLGDFLGIGLLVSPLRSSNPRQSVFECAVSAVIFE